MGTIKDYCITEGFLCFPLTFPPRNSHGDNLVSTLAQPMGRKCGHQKCLWGKIGGEKGRKNRAQNRGWGKLGRISSNQMRTGMLLRRWNL